MESIELTKEKEYGIELVTKDVIRRNPGIVDIRITNITPVLIFCDLVLKRELVEEIGGLKVLDRVVERGEPFVYLSTVYYTYSDSDIKTEARNKLDNFERKISNDLSKIYEKLPTNLKIYNNYGKPLSFSFSTFFVV
jgi:hypothetical protein